MPFDSYARLNRGLITGPIDELFSRLTAVGADMVIYHYNLLLKFLVVSVDDALPKHNCFGSSRE